MVAREVARTPENKVYSKPRLLTDAVMHFCPGCSHGTIHKLIAEVIDEIPMAYKDIDAVMAAQSDLVEVIYTLRQVVCVKG